MKIKLQITKVLVQGQTIPSFPGNPFEQKQKETNELKNKTNLLLTYWNSQY